MGDEVRPGHLHVQRVSLVQLEHPAHVAALPVLRRHVPRVTRLEQEACSGGTQNAEASDVRTGYGGVVGLGFGGGVQHLAVDEVEPSALNVDAVVVEPEPFFHVRHGAFFGRLPLLDLVCGQATDMSVTTCV